MRNNLSDFYSRIIWTGPDTCTRWKGRQDKDGYPMYAYQSKDWRASRLLWTITWGDLQDGLLVRHTCDNPACLNIDHLLIGTPKQNTSDALKRNRMVGPRKINLKEQASINELISKGYSKAEIARTLGVSDSTITNYTRGKQVRHGNACLNHYDDKVRALYNEDLSPTQIGRRLGLTRSQVRAIINHIEFAKHL
jgi:DNA-binding CsgD family transcriptional regulator